MTDETTAPTASRIDEQGRPEPPMAADETGTLLGFLEFQRATLAWKCADLTDEQLRASTAASPITLGGMLKHLAYVEDFWFVETVQGEPSPRPWADVDWRADNDWDWHSAADETGDQLRGLWTQRVENSRAIVTEQLAASVPDPLGQTYPAWGGRAHVSLRWVLTHMIEEYARHNGHADLLRESIDGSTGE